MKLSIRNYYLDTYGLEEGSKRMAEDGYECVDFNFQNTETKYYEAREEDFLEEMIKIKKTLKNSGITVNQIHGPWRFPKDETEDDRAERFGKMTKAMVMAKHLGAKYMAVHPLMPFGITNENPDEVYNINKKYFEALAKVGAGLGVITCLENTPFPAFPLAGCEQLLRLVKEINSPYLKICFDTGHANILGESIGESVRIIGRDYLKIVHCHDNDGTEDSHLPPYEGNIDWSEFCESLYDIGYEGVLSLETDPAKYVGKKDNRDAEISLSKIGKLIAG